MKNIIFIVFFLINTIVFSKKGRDPLKLFLFYFKRIGVEERVDTIKEKLMTRG